MENKFTFNIISDDASVIYLDRSLRRPKWDKKIQEWVLSHMEYKIIGKSLYECFNTEGSPDCYIIDVGCISNHNTNDHHFNLLKKFAEKHSSSLFCVVSFMKPWMESAYNELKSYIDDTVIVEMQNNGNESIADYFYKKVLEYYPYKG